MTSTPSFSQTAYRWFEDGSETASADAGAALSTAIDRYLDGDQSLGLRIRLQITNAVAGASTDDYQLQFSKNGGAFANVTTATTGVKAFNSANLTDQAATTNRLGAGTGSFVAGLVSEDGLADNLLVTASNFTEFLFTIQLVAASLADGDVITFRVLRNGSTITYSVTPQVTVHVPTAALSNGITISNNANTLVTHIGGSVYEIVKITGTSGTYDASAISAGQTGDFVLKVVSYIQTLVDITTGVNSDPTTDNAVASIDYGWQWGSGGLGIWESGTNTNFFSGAATPWQWRTGTTLGYGRGTDLATAQASPDRTVGSVSATLAFDSALKTVGDRVRVLFYVPAASQSLTPSLFTNSQTFYGPTLSATYALSPSLYSNSQTFPSATVTASITLSPSLFTNSQTFYSPTVGAGSQALTPSLFTNGQTFFSAIVTASNTLSPSLLSDGDTLFSATVTATKTLLPPLLTNGQTFFAETVAASNTLSPSLVSDGDTFYSATLTAANTLNAPLLLNSQTFFRPVVSGGSTPSGATVTVFFIS